MTLHNRDFSSEFVFKTSRSSGKGGQHLNKTESRVSLFFNLEQSSLLHSSEKEHLREKLKEKITSEGVLQIDVESSRSQHQNKKIAIERFYQLLQEALKKKKARKLSKPSRIAIKKRLKQKKIQSEKKERRRNDNF